MVLFKNELHRRARTAGIGPEEAARIRREEPDRAQRLEIGLGQALETVRDRIGFTSHTPVPAGRKVYPLEIINYYFGNYFCQSGLERNDLDELIKMVTDAESPGLPMDDLALGWSSYANGVSRLHGTKTCRRLYGERWMRAHPDSGSEGYDRDAITNAVHRMFWQSPLLQKRSKDIMRIPNRAMAGIKAQMKEDAAEELEKIRGVKLDPEAFTIVIARRLATYKRNTFLIKHMLNRLYRIAEERGIGKVQIVLAGKAHPWDPAGKSGGMLQEIMAATINPHHNVCFVKDYDIEVAKRLMKIADVWHSNPIPPNEASETSFMKAGMNGAIDVSTADGAMLEDETAMIFGKRYRLFCVRGFRPTVRAI
ncbi:MAG: glycogen/starch/alpha-glucan phosphorylase, partial [Candidatus Omnitrophota bacterium]